MPLPGDVLEELTALVTTYNRHLLTEKYSAEEKKKASEAILALLKQHQCSKAEAGGCTLSVKPWTRESVNLSMIRALITPDQLARLTRISTGISLDVRPLRVQ